MLSWLRSRALVIVHDLAWVPVAVVLAFWLRFNFDELPEVSRVAMLWMLGTTLPVFAVTFWYFGVYRAVWRFTSFPDLLRIIKAALLGMLVSGVLIFVLRRAEGVPRSVLVLFPMILMLGLTGSRLLCRWLCELGIGGDRPGRKRALIVGAGQPAEALVRQLLRHDTYVPTALVDMDPRMVGKEIHGIRVMGDLNTVSDVLRECGIQIAILATPEASPDAVNDLVAVCSRAHVPCRMVPLRKLSEGGLVEELTLRPITIEDLLRREPVVLDMQEISQHLAGQRVLVTGGGGSIGAELCRQVAAQHPDSLILLDSNEYNLYRIEQDLRLRFPRLALHAILGDVKHEHSVETWFRRFAPQLVFHAAAYKHVPLLEANPLQAVANNVLGTRIVADAAHRHGSAQLVLVSTDKAVNPTNVMGATKRIAELYCHYLSSRSETRYVTTRFGNVLASVGSVVPLFERQIGRGGPVTVTHPEVERYFMTIPEAVSLILQASAMGQGGSIYVLDMGMPVKIKELAEQMIRLAGYVPYDEIPIVFTGLRPGEKLFEELFYEREERIGTRNPTLLLAAHHPGDWQWLERGLTALEDDVRNGRREQVVSHLQQIVEEFVPTIPAPPCGPDLSPCSPRLRVVK